MTDIFKAGDRVKLRNASGLYKIKEGDVFTVVEVSSGSTPEWPAGACGAPFVGVARISDGERAFLNASRFTIVFRGVDLEGALKD